MNRLRSCVWGLVVLAASVQAGPYEQGLIAEADQQWSEAIELYRLATEEDPANLDAWLRLSDVYAAIDEWSLAGEVLREAGDHHPNNAALFHRGARAFSEARQPGSGLEMVQRAVNLEPGNPDYLETQGYLAGWMGQGSLAMVSFEQVLEVSPERTRVLLPLGQQLAWAGDLDEGVRRVRQYLESHPDETSAMLNLADFEIWRGDYVAALQSLDAYRERTGEDEAYRSKRARIMAWVGWRNAAMEILDGLLAADPDNPDLHFSRVLALRHTQPEQALDSLAVVERAMPQAPETIDLGRSTRILMRSRVGLEFNVFNDSDSIRTRSAKLDVSHQLKPGSRIFASSQRQRWSADAGSGLEPRDGSESVDNTRFRIGLSHRFDPDWTMDLFAGRNDVDRVDDSWLYGVSIHWRASDHVSVNLAHGKDLFAISPRTVFDLLGRRATSASLVVRPAISHQFQLDGSYQDISDDNARRALSSDYRYGWIRGQSWNVDLGLSGGWVSFRDNPGSGYYAPGNYRFGGVGVNAYWKISDDDGIGFNAGVGLQKDESFDSFESYYDVSADAVFGIFRDWQLRLSAGYSDRRNQSGGFDAVVGSVRIERRF